MVVVIVILVFAMTILTPFRTIVAVNAISVSASDLGRPDNGTGTSNYANSTVMIPNPRGIAAATSGYYYVAGGCSGACTNGSWSPFNPVSKAYAIDSSNSILSTTPIPGPYAAQNVAVDSSTGMLWVVTSFGSLGGQLVEIDPSSSQIVKELTIFGGATPSIMDAINPNTDAIYVTIPNPFNPIFVVDGSTYNQSCISLMGCSSAFPLNGSEAEGVAVNPVTNTIYVTASPNILFIVDGSSNTITKTIALPFPSPSFSLFASYPSSVAVDPLSNRVYVVDGPYLYVLNGDSGAILAKVSFNVTPASVAVIHNSQTNDLYVSSSSASNGSSFLFVVSGSSDGLVETIPLGNTNDGYFYDATNPKNNQVFAECCGSDVLVFTPQNEVITNQTTNASATIVSSNTSLSSQSSRSSTTNSPSEPSSANDTSSSSIPSASSIAKTSTQTNSSSFEVKTSAWNAPTTRNTTIASRATTQRDSSETLNSTSSSITTSEISSTATSSSFSPGLSFGYRSIALLSLWVIGILVAGIIISGVALMWSRKG